MVIATFPPARLRRSVVAATALTLMLGLLPLAPDADITTVAELSLQWTADAGAEINNA